VATLLLLLAVFQAAPALRVANVAGAVEVWRNGQAAGPRVGETSAAGDRFRTGAGSFLILVSDSGARVELLPNSSLELDATVTLQSGSLQLRAASGSLRVATRFGTFQTEGSIVDANFADDGETVAVTLLRGALRPQGLDAAKVVFKAADDAGPRTYTAGSDRPPNTTLQPPPPGVIVVPRVTAPR
jgi:hypothetical protein